MRKTIVCLDFINDLGGGAFRLEGYLAGRHADVENLFFIVNGERFTPVRAERVWSADSAKSQKPLPGEEFEVDVRIDNMRSNKVSAQVSGRPAPIKTNRYTGLSRLLFSFKARDSLLWIRFNGKLTIRPDSTALKVLLEAAYLICILFNWRVLDAWRRISSENTPGGKARQVLKAPLIIGEAIVMIPRAIVLRLAYRFYRRRAKNPIWIVSDRAMAAGDNGEAFFKYLASRSDVPADVYFAISHKSPDCQRVAKMGKVLDHGSLRYQLKFLLSEKIISSQADIEIINPFIRQINHYVDLFNFDFIFLQHGIIRHDLSGWLNKFDKNIQLFITSSRREYDSILTNPYYYKRENLVLSGLPRFDYLKNNPKNKLILAPTYRNFLINGPTNKLGQRKYNPHFKKSDYFKFYNRFMNDGRLLEVMRRKGMTGEFYLHPNFEKQVKDFEDNETFKLMNFPYDYGTAFKEGSLLISDYSSITFDFAYMGKPVIYAHFDEKAFFAGHTSTKSDFFNDETDGFGPVCFDYNQLLQKTIEIIESDCKMTVRYKKRVEKYFAYNDRRNSERVYGAILGARQGESNG